MTTPSGSSRDAFDAWRIEVKATLDERRLHVLDAWISAHPFGFIQPYPDRWVNNVYFDTPSLAAYEENLAGVSTRRKVRLRWYGDSRIPATAALEVKLRRNALGAKRRAPVVLESSDSVTWRELRGQLRDQVTGSTAADLAWMCEPVILNRYLRTYLVAERSDIRVTIDRELRFVDQRVSASPRYEPAHELQGCIVFEMKVPASLDPRSALRNLPMRLSRHSKYAIGVRTILAGV